MVELVQMVAERRRMSNEERAELIAAIEQGGIRNVSEYARAFAARHDLNPQSVRTAITRLRRQLGLLERPSAELLANRQPPIAREADSTGKQNPPLLEFHRFREDASGRLNALTLLTLAEATDPRFARLAAAALIRYENDEDFRRAVDEQRPQIESFYWKLTELREGLESLPLEEREEILRFLAPG